MTTTITSQVFAPLHVEDVAIIVAAVSVVVAAVSIFKASAALRAQQRTSSRRAALDFVVTHEVHDTEWRALSRRVGRILSDESEWQALLVDPTGDDFNDVLIWLEHHELVALAVQRKTLDRSFCVDWFGQTYGRDWDVASEFVAEYRRRAGVPNLYERFEKLAALRQWRALGA